MKRLIFLLALAGPALAQTTVDMWTPVIGTKDCQITGVTGTGTTPAVVTVASTAGCGITTSGQKIKIWGIWNSGLAYSAVNDHLVNSSDTNGFCRETGTVTSTTFQVKACDGSTNVTNDGTYSSGGHVARAQLRTRRALPILEFDGVSGAFTTSLSDTTSSGLAWASRPEKSTLDTAASGLPADMTKDHTDFYFTNTIVAALEHWALGLPGSGTYKTKTHDGLVHSSFLIPSTACDGTSNCTGTAYYNAGASSLMDYSLEESKMYGHLRGWNLGLDWALSSGERQTIANYLFNDRPWTQGGVNYTGTTLSFPSFRAGRTGNISVSFGSTTVTGSGTNFVTQGAVAGDYIWLGTDFYALQHKICSVNSETSITLCSGNAYSALSGSDYIIGPAFNEATDLGFVPWMAMNAYSSFCKPPYPASTACPFGAVGNGGQEFFGNHDYGRLVNIILMALTFAHVDPRARLLAEDELFHWYHRWQPQSWRAMGGMLNNAAGYYTIRPAHQFTSIVGGLTNAFSDDPDFLGPDSDASEAWWDAHAMYQFSNMQPGRKPVFWATGGETHFIVDPDWPWLGANILLYKPNSQYAAGIKYYIQNDLGNYSNGSQDAVAAYLAMGPRVTAARSTATSFVSKTDVMDGCSAIWGSNCSKQRHWFFASRSGTSAANTWGSAALSILYRFQSQAVQDHNGQGPSFAPQVGLNGKLMLAGDGDGGNSIYGGCFAYRSGHTIESDNCGIMRIGGDNDLFKYGYVPNANDPVDGVGTAQRLFAHTTPTVAAVGADITDYYSSATAATFVGRGAIHIKAGWPGYFIQWDRFTTSSSKLVEVFYHYFTGDSCGTPVSCAAISVSRSSRTVALSHTGARVNTKFLTGGTLNTDNNSDTNGSYTNGRNLTFRLTSSTTGTSGSFFAVHQFDTNTSTTMPTIVETTVDTSKAIEIQDGSHPVLAVLAPVGVPALTSLSGFTNSTNNTYFVATGFAAGYYDIKENGVTKCANVEAVSGDGILECSDVDASTVSIAVASGAPLTITTTSLPTGTVGSAYSQTLAATGGTAPYTWSLSGSCSGLSLDTSTGVYSGTPLSAGTCSLDFTVTDAAMGTDSQHIDLVIGSAPVSGVGTNTQGKITTGGKVVLK